MIRGFLFATSLTLSGCQNAPTPQHFQVSLKTLIEQKPNLVQTLDHYGLLVVDATSGQIVAQRTHLTPGTKLKLLLKKNTPYFILIIAKDASGTLLYAKETLETF